MRTTRIGGSSRTSWSPRSAARGAARDRGAIRAAGDARGAFRVAAVGTEDRAEEATAREDAPDARARTTRAATIARGAAVVAAMTVCESDAVLEPSCDDRSARGREWRATWSTSARSQVEKNAELSSYRLMTDRACGPSAGGETETPPPATPLDGRASDRRKKNPSPLHARGSLGPSRANDASPSRALLFLSLPSPAARVTAVRRKNTTPNRSIVIQGRSIQAKVGAELKGVS